MAKKTNKSKPTKTDVPEVSLVLEANNQTYIGKGRTVAEAIQSLGLDASQIKTKGQFTVFKGERKIARLLILHNLRVIFSSHLRRDAIAKQMEFLLK